MITVRYVNAAGRVAAANPQEPPTDRSGGWRAETWLGAPAPGGLALPPAHPTSAWLYAPRGVHIGQVAGRDILVVADTGNHRVLIWHSWPDADEQPADVVLGQPDFMSEGPAAGGGGPEEGMYLPTGVAIDGGNLVIADAWHHRVLIYDGVPERSGARPAVVLGQSGPTGVEPNRGAEATATSMYWPFGIAVVGGRFYVADTGNRRVLGWSGGLPSSPDTPADLILGQADAFHREENRGADAGAGSFRWPHDITGTDELLLVADAGNHRVLGWGPHPRQDRPASHVFGQPDFDSAGEWPYAPQRADTLRFPYAARVHGQRLAVADTANNRVLVWDRLPSEAGVQPPADAVLGQPSFSANGENRWDRVSHDTLCWPYGISLHGDRLAVADSGNNRVVIWRRT